jgi:tripartite ATP-independent transporter DctM subunit
METSMFIILISLGVLLVLLALGVHIAFAMGIIGFVGIWYFGGLNPALAELGITPIIATSNFLLAAIPLFFLMGALATHARITRDLFDAATAWIGHIKGGLGMATIVGCAGFAAISGSSLATSATMGAVALPEMKRLGYDPKFGAGCVAAGGTLGIMIPPSILFIIYGYLTEVSVGKLFIAGILPGILSAVMFMVTISILPLFVPNIYPSFPSVPWSTRLRASKGLILLMAVFVMMMGSIYAGLATPTEAAAIGFMATFLIGMLRRKITASNMQASLLQAGWNTAMIFTIIVGATIFSHYLTLTKFPQLLSSVVLGLGTNKWVILIAIIMLYIALGMFLETLSMLLLTLPIIFPVVTNLGFDGIWFGIITCKVFEIALITPPVGMNVYVIAGIATDVSLQDIFLGILPFLIAELITITLLVIFPQISLFLPATM